MMPIFFIGHGSPMNAIEETEFSRTWQTLTDSIPTPKAILCISAHWITEKTSITSNDFPPTIHDFGGFPKELFEVNYHAPGDRNLAKQIADSLSEIPAVLDTSWGLDHGTWSILRHIYPDANIPVLQLSIRNTPDGNFHFNLGKKLQNLRNQDILLVGSGNLIHNLRLADWGKMNDSEYGFDWAIRANNLFKSLILNREDGSLIHYESLGPDIDLAIPTPEHFIPFLYILGASSPSDKIQFFNDKVVMGSLNMTSVRYG
jgi:4,5-DOPA dioxygenase extradiol